MGNSFLLLLHSISTRAFVFIKRIDEIKAGLEILKSLNLKNRGVKIISCPSCARQAFEVIKTVEVLEKKLEDIQNNPENYDEKYLEVIDKVSQLGGINTWITTKDKKYEIKIDDIEPSTSLISYRIKEPYKWQVKGGKTDINSLISMVYNEKLFNMMEHLDKFSILRNKTFL